MNIYTKATIKTIASILLCVSFAPFLVQCKSGNQTGTGAGDLGWRFNGHLGDCIDRISENRILNEASWNLIYPETEKAFLIREDDSDYPERGVWRG